MQNFAHTGQWCPEENANVWSKMFFTYVESILTLGYRKPLENGDLWDMADRDTASKVSADFQDTLCTGANKGSVGKSMWKQFGTPFVRAGWLKLVHDIIMFTGKNRANTHCKLPHQIDCSTIAQTRHTRDRYLNRLGASNEFNFVCTQEIISFWLR